MIFPFNFVSGCRSQIRVTPLLLLLGLIPAAAQSTDGIEAASAGAARMGRYNVVWSSPSKDATGVMPIGNGDIAAGVYALADGDLYLLLAKNDAFNYAGEIYKTGRVRISLSPNPFQRGKPFRQTLDLPTGSIQIEADGVTLRLWVDANRPVYHVEITSPREISLTARPEFWNRLDNTRDVRQERAGNLLWYFAVGDRSVFPDDLKFYEVEPMAAKMEDPYRFNTFGNLLESPALRLDNGVLTGVGKAFDLRVHACAMKAPAAGAWIERIERQAAQPMNTSDDWQRHCRWWEDFWDRSWIVVSDNTLPVESREKFLGEPDPSGSRAEADGAALVAQSYNVFRFLMACQSRGRIQAKFNGGLFTQPLRVASANGRPGAVQQKDGSWLTHEDDRLWGRRFTFQNQRLLYWPLLASGDFELMKPFFDYYWNLLPMRTAITKAWFGHDGAYFRENIEPTGAERDCDHGGRPPKTKPGEKYEGWYHDYYFTSGLEILVMMIEYVKYTGDLAFRDRVLVPFASEVLLFFDQHYLRSADGKIRLEPAQVLETFWIAVNPAPDVAGLRVCLDDLLALKAGTGQDQARWRRFRDEIPEVPLHLVEGRQAIAPAEKWDKRSNAENGELYPVFPFGCFGLGLGTGDIVDWTMKQRTNKDAFNCACWTQDQIHWAYAGRAREARDGLVRRFRIASTMCRFPLYGREGPDSCPDFDHFGAGATALQRLLVQEAGDKIVLLPAWPADWDVDFKLHLTGRTVITGTVKDGKLVAWDIQPSARKNSVVVCQPQSSASTRTAVLPETKTVLTQDAAWKFPCPTNEIARYTAHRITEPIHVDGRLDEPAWQTAPASPRFVDLISGQPTLHDTRAMVVWDDQNVYVAYRVEEPKVQATFRTHNDPIYYDNDVEFFIAGPDAYYEFELNAYNTSYEVFFIWEEAYEKGGFAQAPEFARSKLKPFNGVGFTNHPRGGRFGQFEWTFPGKQTAVHIDGTVNDDRDTDRGWTVELAFPWKGLQWLATDGRALPPRDGDVWRMDFSRFNTYKASVPARDSGGWVWTRHGAWDSHIPECFVFVQFTSQGLSGRVKD